ncbi:MAG TPA: hypothetical protein PKI11_10715 [Candidatus Hydrogenedentes bacterium]|nr:hypothetical protein [Candidatus Hydrogenedentota bacterium]HNT89386.1 hypothetical protein [Candidatus Hydrogenedentota bacterium]
MSLNARRTWIRFLIFGVLGLAFEVFGTGLSQLRRGRIVMRGYSSPWMIPVYGMLGVIFWPIAARLREWRIPLPLRAVVYMLGIFAVEFVSGMIFLAVGLNKIGGSRETAVWDYSGDPYALYGQISLRFVPAWYFLGFIAERVYLWVDTWATALALRKRAEDLL